MDVVTLEPLAVVAIIAAVPGQLAPMVNALPSYVHFVLAIPVLTCFERILALEKSDVEVDVATVGLLAVEAITAAVLGQLALMGNVLST